VIYIPAKDEADAAETVGAAERLICKKMSAA